MFLTVAEVKKHLNIDAGFTEDDDYIQSLIDVAEAVVQEHIDYNLADLCDLDGNGEVDASTLPAPLIHAMKLFIGNMYANRESVAFTAPHEIPLSFNYLLSLYKNYVGRTIE